MNGISRRTAALAGFAAILVLGPAFGQPAASARSLADEGMRALAEGRETEALARLRAAAKLSPGDAGIAFHLGVALVRLGNYKQAVAPLRRGMADKAHAEEARYLLGSSLFQIGVYAEAAGVLDPLRQSKYAADVLYMMEESFRRTKNAEGAKLAFVELSQRFSQSAQLHKLMGIAYDASEDWDSALTEFQQALKADPKMPEIRFAIGLMYLKKGEDAAAGKWMSDELALNRCYAAAHFYLGEMDRWADRLAAAADSYRKAIACNGGYVDARLGLGAVLKRQGKVQESLRQFEEAVRLAPSDRRTHFQLATALREAGQTERANAEFAKVRQFPVGGDRVDGGTEAAREEKPARVDALIK